MYEASSSNAAPQLDAPRGLSERVEWMKREVPHLVLDLRCLERRLAVVTAEKNRLQEEVNRFRGSVP